jgi:putative FmdB family regulatory protein
MPIYEYKCQECGTHSEKIQSVSAEPLTLCEKCGGHLEKQISLSGFQFKGAGWYVTDYAGKTATKTSVGEKTEKTSATESTAKPESASNTTSDAAPAPKKEAAAKKD